MTEERSTNQIEKFNVIKARQIFGLGLTSLLCGPLFGFISSFLRRLLDPISVNPARGFSTSFIGFILGLTLSISTIVMFIKSYKMIRQLKISWVGLILASLVGIFWIFMVAGEILFPH